MAKRTQISPARVSAIPPQGGNWATVHREAGVTTIALNLEEIGRATHTLGIDCGAAVERHGQPELHFGCLSRDDKRLTREVVVRYEYTRFIERAGENDQFRAKLETDVRRIRPPGFFSSLHEKAAPTEQILTIDVEAEAISYVGGAAGMIFISASNMEVSLATQGKKPTFEFRPDLELTMRTDVLGDVLASWRRLIDRIKVGR